MIDISSTLKDSSKDKENSIRNSFLENKSISASIISDTSPVYLFCTSKNGINSKNENGWTPIYRSIIANNLIALNELLNLGSDPNISNNLGETPLYLCVDIDNYDALIILLQYNADTNIAKRNGTTPLHLAAKKNKNNFMHALLRNKANPNLPNKLYSQTATHIAIINKIDEEMLSIFHEYNADIYNVKDKYDKTPFDYAKELKDDEYIELLIKIFGDKNNKDNEKDSKQAKTVMVEKIPEEIKKNNDKFFDLPKNFHNSNYNIQPEKISINNMEEYHIENNSNADVKEDNKIGDILENKDKENKDNNIENTIVSDKHTLKYGILNSGDPLYSDRTLSKNSETNKSKKDKDNNISDNKYNFLNNNNLSEFQPIPASIMEGNEIKNKNSLIKNFKSNINIDTKMIDNSKDIIIMNDNNEVGNDNIEVKEKNKDEDNIDNYNEKNNNINELNSSCDENKIKTVVTNNDKEIIKNIISSTVKKIKVNTNTYNSEFSSLNNNSINKNINNVNINDNNSNSKNEVLKLINFSSNNNSNTSHKEDKLRNNSTNTNLDKYIETNNGLENGTSSFILYNNLKKIK